MTAAAIGSPWLCAIGSVLLAALAPAQEREIAFPSQAEAITVDVIVLDKEGRPVRGLGSADFSVIEDGKEQPIVGFAARDLAQPQPEAPASAAVGLPSAQGDACFRSRWVASPRGAIA